MEQETTNYVAYLRRSKKEQSSNLGLEAQKQEVYAFAERKGGIILNTFIEIESGTNRRLNKRTVIFEAIKYCAEHNATLIIAKLDRLARDVEFTSRLMNSGVKFIACDVPLANEFTIHVMAAVAQQEAKRISERTIAALRQKKERGEPLGYWTHKKRFTKLDDSARDKAAMVLKKRASENPNNTRAKAYAKELHVKGISYDEITTRMNREGFLSPMGKKVYRNTVVRWVAQP